MEGKQYSVKARKISSQGTQPASSEDSTAKTQKASWRGRLVEALKEIKDKIVGFIDRVFLKRKSIDITKPNDNLKISAKTMPSSTKFKVSKKIKESYISKLQKNGFTKKQAQATVKQKIAESRNDADLESKINDIPEYKYFNKFGSKSAIKKHIEEILDDIAKLGYPEPSKYEKKLYLHLDKSDNFAEFDAIIDDFPSFQDYELGYESALELAEDINRYLKILANYGYNIHKADKILEKICEDVNTKDDILARVIETPTVKMVEQGYSGGKEYRCLFEEQIEKLKPLVDDEVKMRNEVKQQQEQLSKEEFISNISKKIDDLKQTKKSHQQKI